MCAVLSIVQYILRRIFEEALVYAEKGIIINGCFLNNLIYTPDAVCLQGLYQLMAKITETRQQSGLR